MKTAPLLLAILLLAGCGSAEPEDPMDSVSLTDLYIDSEKPEITADPKVDPFGYFSQKGAIPPVIEEGDGVELSFYQTGVTDDDLAYLKDIKSVHTVHMSHQFSDSGMAHLKGLSDLRVLSVEGAEVTDAGMQHLAGLNLDEIAVNVPKLTDAGLEPLSGMQNLTDVEIDGILTDGCFQHLSGLTKLRTLWLVARSDDFTGEGFHLLADSPLEILNVISHSTLTDAGLEGIGQLSTLRELDLDETEIEESGLRHLAALKNLRLLNLRLSGIGDAGLVHLQGLEELQTLHLGRTNISDAGLEPIGKIASLKSLDVVETSIGDAGLAHLKSLENLEVLWLWDTKITDAGLRHLHGLSKLTDLRIYRTGMTKAGLVKLAKALPKCTIDHDIEGAEEIGQPAY